VHRRAALARSDMGQLVDAGHGGLQALVHQDSLTLCGPANIMTPIRLSRRVLGTQFANARLDLTAIGEGDRILIAGVRA